MPNLSCNVGTCSHNKASLCCKEGITVGGQQASVSASTCCDSFEEKSGAFTNNFESPNASLSVSCEATNCTYNQSRMCAAETISISGPSACAATQTECSSFVPKL